jgi:hypothetical protein
MATPRYACLWVGAHVCLRARSSLCVCIVLTDRAGT